MQGFSHDLRPSSTRLLYEKDAGSRHHYHGTVYLSCLNCAVPTFTANGNLLDATCPALNRAHGDTRDSFWRHSISRKSRADAVWRKMTDLP